ncbi:MAG: cytidine deaminase, partial [bacterium]
LDHAKQAQENAVAIYSNFPVGAAVETHDGEIYTGCNIEVSSYGLTICAERVALFKAISEGARGFKTLAIVAQSNDFCPPCGACRQVIFDYAPDVTIVMINAKGEIKTATIAELLPEAFNKDFLSK